MTEIVGAAQIANALGSSRRAEARLDQALSRIESTDPALRDEKTWEAAQEFEAVFLSQMLSPVFESIDSNEITGGGSAEKMWRGLMVQEYGKQMTRAGGVGIAEQVYKELLKAQEGG
ncbi:MAG: rod-binding protein [Alphaproteobacteria bacterium]